MSLHEYLCSQAISRGDAPFYALLFALMRRADDRNAAKLKIRWPDAWEEMQACYDAPGGVLDSDNADPKALRYQRVEISGKVTEGKWRTHAFEDRTAIRP